MIIYDGGTELNRQIVLVTGNWTYTATALVEGDHSFTAVVEDPAGNQSPPSTAIAFTVDTTAPIVPTITNAVDDTDDIVTLNNGEGTDDMTPTLNGTGEAGSTIYVQYGPSAESWQDASTSVIVGTDGTWSWTSPPQTRGSWDFRVRSEDTAGNTSVYTSKFVLVLGSPIITRAVDDMGPNIGDVLTGERTDDTTLTLYGTADPETTVYIEYGKNTAGWTQALAPVTADNNGEWSWIAPTLASGFIWEFRAKSVDAASVVSPYSPKFRVTIGPDTTSFVGTDASQTVALGITAPDNPTAITTNTNSVNVEYDGSQLSVGDSINLSIGNERYDYALTQADIVAGMVTINVPTELQPLTVDDVGAAIVDAAGNNSQYISHVITVTTEDFSTVTDTSTYLAGNTLTLADMQVTVLEGRTQVDTYFSTYPTNGSGNRLYFGHSSEYGTPGDRLEITPNTPCTSITFTTDHLDNPASYSFYDTAGNLLETLEFAGSISGYTVTYTAPAGVLIGSIQAYTTDWGFMDNFQFYQLNGFEFQDAPSMQTISGEEFGAHYGTSGNDVFSLADVSGFTNSVYGEIHGGSGNDTLAITGSDQLLNLTNLVDKVKSIEIIDLDSTNNNTLNLTLSDVLEQGGVSLFNNDGFVQMMVKGTAGDTVNLDDLMAGSINPGNWANSGQLSVSGVVYEVYRHDALDAELLVQQGVQTNLV